jgi:chromosome segregation ATPase
MTREEMVAKMTGFKAEAETKVAAYNLAISESNNDGAEVALKDAENAAETLRNSIDSLKSELSSRIESEQTYAPQCEDLKDQVAKKEAEINNLKNVCDKQAGEISKLEASQG